MHSIINGLSFPSESLRAYIEWYFKANKIEEGTKVFLSMLGSKVYSILLWVDETYEVTRPCCI